MEKGDFARLGEALDRLKTEKLTRDEREMWWHSRGLVEFQSQNRDAALQYFEEGARRFPESVPLLFSLGQEYEAKGKIDEARDCWDGIKLAEAHGSMMLAIARYLYLWGYHGEAQVTIQPLFDRYYALGNVDDHFLYVNGLPFFDESFGYRASFALLTGRPEIASKELSRVREELPAYDTSALRLYLDAARTGEWSPVLERLREYLATEDSEKYPTGYQRMQQAVIKARQSSSLEEAMALLDDVVLSKRDFAWLEQIRDVTRAEAAHRFGEDAEEDRWLHRLFEKQPLLFEPHHAFRFDLLTYQELLKSRYQAGRRAALSQH